MILVLNRQRPLNGNNMNFIKNGIVILLLLVGFLGRAQSFFNYTVKQGDSRWEMAQDFGISLDSLWALNPHLSQYSMELPVGIVVKLPMVDVRKPLSRYSIWGMNTKVIGPKKYSKARFSDQIPFLDSLIQPAFFSFAYALPFRLDKMNFQDSLLGQKTMEARRDMKLSLSFYSGALMAIDSLQKLGIYVTPRPIDTQLDGTVLYNNLYQDSLPRPDAIFGPLLASVNPVVLNFAKQYNIPAVLPVVSQAKVPYTNAFYPVPKEEVLRTKLLNYAQKTYRGEKVLLIADQENKETATAIKKLFPRAFEVALINNISIEIDTFATQLDSVIPNWVFVETENLKLVSSVSSILNANITEKVKIKMFTTQRNKAFENDVIDNQHLSALQFCFPSFYKNTIQNSLITAFEERFGVYPDPLAIRGFDLTMDMALKMAYYKGYKAAQQIIGPVIYANHKLHYSPLFSPNLITATGYYNQASFIMQYEHMDVKLIE